MVNTALYLRRPLLVTGKPGVGKSSLACSAAWELGLGSVLHWPINTRSSLREGLYSYDAIGRLQELQLAKYRQDMAASPGCSFESLNPEAIGRYVRLGPLGTALLASDMPRVLLIDEIDKSDIDLPNDLLNVFEEGEFEIPELSRLADVCPDVSVLPHDGKEPVTIRRGRVRCNAFPFVVLTSNGERELPPPFLRRCLRLDIPEPDENKLGRIVAAHFGEVETKEQEIRGALIEKFLERRQKGELATDQLLNAVDLTTRGIDLEAGASEDRKSLMQAIFRYLDRQDIR
jgi:MoxR-like ATPase